MGGGAGPLEGMGVSPGPLGWLALAFFCLLSSAARLLLKVSVLGDRLEGRLREGERWCRLCERDGREDGYGLRLGGDFPRLWGTEQRERGLRVRVVGERASG